MFITRDRAREPERRLISVLSLAVQENALEQAHNWIMDSLNQLNMHSSDRARLIAALAQKLEGLLEITQPSRLKNLTIRLYSTSSNEQAGQGWSFFTIIEPLQAARVVLEIFIYS